MESKVWNPTLNRNHLIRDAIGLGIYDCMKVDPSIYLFGEGASMKIHFDCPAIEKEFPERVITLPISEDGNTDFAVGASLVGVKPVVDVITSDFLFRTMDGICLAPDTLVLGDNKQIVEYNVGDSCLGVSGAVKVVQSHKRKYSGPIMEVKAAGLLPFRITPEHPVLTAWGECIARSGYKTTLSDKRWKKAGELTPKRGSHSGDYLIVPRITGTETITEIDLSPHIAEQRGNRNSGIVRAVPLTTETAWLIGLYVAEGFPVTTRLGGRTPQCIARLTLGKHEADLVERAKAIAQKAGIAGHVSEKASTLWLDLYSVPFARYLANACGKGARNKKIPEMILMHQDIDILRAFLDGYGAGDGCITEYNRPGHSPILSHVTASKVLAQQLQLAWARLGVLAGISVGEQPKTIMGRPVNAGPLYHVRFALPSPTKTNRNGIKMLPDCIAVPVRRVTSSEYSGMVCNLETADNTYLVSNAVVHNCNTAPKVNFVTGTVEEKKTVVIRSENITFGLTTGQRLESLFTHIPGLNVIYPSTPKDARGLIRTALRRPGVTLFFEDRMIMDSDTRPADIEDEGKDIPFGKARVVHEGSQLTVVSYALTLQRARKVIEAKSALKGCELIDLRSLYPLDIGTIRRSVRKTGKLLVIEPDVTFSGMGAEILAEVAESSDVNLSARAYREGSPRSMIPASHFLHKNLIPTEQVIEKVIRERLG